MVLLLPCAYLIIEILLAEQIPSTIVAYYTLNSEKKGAFKNVQRFTNSRICIYSTISVSEYLTKSKQPQWTVTVNDSSKSRSLSSIQESLRAIAPRHLTLSRLRADLTDKELKAIEGMVSIDTLRLQGTAISDDSIPILLSLPKLCYLDVRETRITENGLSQIVQNFKPEKYLMIIAFDIEVSPEFYENYKKVNPRITIQCKIKNESESDNAESLENPP